MRFFKKHISLFILFLFLIATIVIIIKSSEYNDYFCQLYNNDSFHYSLITLNSVIAGFLFSGISILVSLISIPSIKRLWSNGYLDNLYHSGILGITLNIISIIFGFIITLKLTIFNFNQDTYQRVLTILELATMLNGLVCFIICVSELVYCINILRRSE